MLNLRARFSVLGAAIGIAMVGGTFANEGIASAAVTHHVYRTCTTPGGCGMWLRATPTPNAAHLGLTYDGDAFSVNCWQLGATVINDPVWLQGVWKGKTGWAEDYYIDTHWATTADLTRQGIPQCGTSSTPPAAQGAINWAKARIGQALDQGWCLLFVHDAYLYGGGREIGSAPTAVAWWNAHTSTQHRGDTNPPAGALVFWGATATNSAGHVALSLGGGQVISSEERSTSVIHTFSISSRNADGYPYLGWIMP